MRQIDSPTTFETVKVVGQFGNNKLHLFVPADRKGEWFGIPPTFQVTIDDDSELYKIEMNCAVNPETNVVEIVEFKATKRDVQIQDGALRKISLAAIRNEAIRAIGEIYTEGKDGKIHGNFLAPRRTVSDDVVRRGVRRQRNNSFDPERAKQIADFARALVDKGEKNWLQMTLQEFSLSRAEYYRDVKGAKFSVRQHKRKAKKK
jgi:hypothetical protein